MMKSVKEGKKYYDPLRTIFSEHSMSADSSLQNKSQETNTDWAPIYIEHLEFAGGEDASWRGTALPHLAGLAGQIMLKRIPGYVCQASDVPEEANYRNQLGALQGFQVRISFFRVFCYGMPWVL